METLKKLKLKHVPLLIISVLIVFVLIVWLINRPIFDAVQSDGVKRVLEPHKMPSAQKNAYFYLNGLTAADARSPWTTGKALHERYIQNKNDLNIDNLTDADYREILGEKNLDEVWLNQFERCLARTENRCLERNISNFKKVDITEPRLAEMLKRYDSLTQFKQYAHPNTFSFLTPLPSFSHPMTLQQISLTSVYVNSNNDMFIQAIEKDLKFWRMMLSQGSSLIDKMVAIAAIWNDVRYVSELIANRALTNLQKDAIKNLLLPLTIEELDIGESFIFEAKAMYLQLENITTQELETFFEGTNWLLSPLILPNATNNTHYELFLSPLLALSKLDSQSFYKALPNGAAKYQEAFNINFSPSNLYNLGGKMLLSNSGWMASDYIARVHDINGFFSVVSLQLELSGLTEEAHTTRINESKYRNPYSNKPLDYDKETQQLGFECMNKGSNCKVYL